MTNNIRPVAGNSAQVFEFVSAWTGVDRGRLSPDTTLFGDLGVDGADGWELVEAFGKEFGVDLSLFRADQHFGPEGLPIHVPLVWMGWLMARLFRRKETPEQRANLRPIRLADLVAAANEGQWTL